MKPVYKVGTLKRLYVCEVFEHPTEGYIWRQADGELARYCVIPSPKHLDMLTLLVNRSYGQEKGLVLEPANKPTVKKYAS
jgi:hypothetical protein